MVFSPAVTATENIITEFEATQFSATTKLSGIVRFVTGSGYRAAGYANFAQAAALTDIAQLYGQRSYDGSVLAVQNRFINQIPSPQSQGEAFVFYRASAPHHLAANWPSAPAGLDTYQIT
ncbi:MAG: hypothetical protein O2922_02285 [Cyanobacteria bacterium]|nr:hypothetical protein [Cyanobacteriota bacterium]